MRPTGDTQGGNKMAKKLTLRQQEKLFRERQRQNFQASSALDGVQVEVITLDNEQISQRLTELRKHYER
jgi:hypothetical protein